MNEQILIVDDSHIIREVLSDLLTGAGYRTVTAPNAREALELVLRGNADLILLDQVMPGLGGLELLCQLKLREATRDVPVIMVTGAEGDELLTRSFEAGARDYIAKPFRKVAVLARVKAALETHRIEMQLRQAKKDAKAASEAKSDFLANMSHEIRTPMTAILGFADVLLREAELDAPEHRDALCAIQRTGQYLLGLINDIFDLSKIEAGKVELEEIPFSVTRLLAEVESLMQVRAAGKSLRFVVELAEGVPSDVYGDPTRLRQILVNLVGNAIKFTEEGHVRLDVRIDGTEPGRQSLEMAVTDTGIGMTDDQLERLFQPFTQADNSTSRRFGGTGLGLMISRRLIEALGGRMSVASKPGRGSVFTLAIPVEIAENTCAGQTASPLTERFRAVSVGDARSSPLNARILLAEDGLDNQRLISHVLEKAGADVSVAEDGLAAVGQVLDAAKAGNPFDLVLMDIQMPRMDGYTATGRLRSLGMNVPVIALTAHAMSEDHQKCIDAGCDTYCTKPIQRDTLIDTIARCVGASRQNARN